MIKIWCPQMGEQRAVRRTPNLSPPSDALLLRTFQLEHCDCIWFARFAVDQSQGYHAAGNTEVVVYLWNIGARSTKPVELPRFTIRYLSFAQDGSVLVASTIDGALAGVLKSNDRKGAAIPC